MLDNIQRPWVQHRIHIMESCKNWRSIAMMRGIGSKLRYVSPEVIWMNEGSNN